MRLNKRRLALVASVVLLGAAGYLLLALWADDRNQRFYEVRRAQPALGTARLMRTAAQIAVVVTASVLAAGAVLLAIAAAAWWRAN